MEGSWQQRIAQLYRQRGTFTTRGEAAVVEQLQDDDVNHDVAQELYDVQEREEQETGEFPGAMRSYGHHQRTYHQRGNQSFVNPLAFLGGLGLGNLTEMLGVGGGLIRGMTNIFTNPNDGILRGLIPRMLLDGGLMAGGMAMMRRLPMIGLPMTIMGNLMGMFDGATAGAHAVNRITRPEPEPPEDS